MARWGRPLHPLHSDTSHLEAKAVRMRTSLRALPDLAAVVARLGVRMNRVRWQPAVGRVAARRKCGKKKEGYLL